MPAEAKSSAKVISLRTEYRTNPIGIDIAKPRFYWVMQDERRGARQSAYQVVVKTGDQTVWDSGEVKSDESTHIEYSGKPLQPRTAYSWQVRIWDELGRESSLSAKQTFETGLMKQGWQAEWIEAVREDLSNCNPAAFLRKEFGLDKKVTRARLYATGLGVYEFHINGKRVGDAYFAPGWTKYEKRVQYQTYDVTSLLKKGSNAIGAILGDGWYCGSICGAWEAKEKRYGSQPRLRAQLVVDFEDGTSQVVFTDATWKFSTGPIVMSDFYMGETYDARLEFGLWTSAGFDDAKWGQTRVAPAAQVAAVPVVAQQGPPVRATKTIKPKSLKEVQPGVWIFDMGQNMVGWERLSVKGPAGTEITVRHAEMLNPDGTMYTTNLRRAKATSLYTLKGSGEEVFEPHFAFFGFQYVELTGFPGTPTLDTITGIVLHSDMPQTGSFECSEPLINQLQHNIEWGQRGNYLDIPTDCPQRDERLGWTGDAQVFVRTAAFNFDIAGFFTKWLWDLDDSQSKDGKYPNVAPELPDGQPAGVSAWADAGVICPWTVYQCYGDTRILAQHYPNMKKWVEHQRKNSKNLIFNRSWFGDWLSTNATTPGDLISTAFFAWTAKLLAKSADVLGKKQEAREYAKLSEQVTKAFRAEFVSPNGRVSGETQTAYLLGVHFGLLEPRHLPYAEQWLCRDIDGRKGHLSCGFVGSPYINHVLTKLGRLDKAYELLNQKEWPSWLYAVTQGATTIWERWDGWTHDKGFQTPGMNSFNHYAYGAIGEWLYGTVAGIDVDEKRPGYKHVIIKPRPGGGLTHAKAALDSINGRIESGWKLEGKRLVVEVLIPANTSASISLPAKAAAKVKEGGKAIAKADGLKVKGVKDGVVTIEAGAGKYCFEVAA
jgi:alpha-L-rhamnosidase